MKCEGNRMNNIEYGEICYKHGYEERDKEIVRCMDCIYVCKHEDGCYECGNGFCEVKADFYCADGERKTMDKYVKADRLKEKCAESCKYVRVGNEEYLSVGDVCRIVDEMPSADVVEVVRCKDCKYRRKGLPYCGYFGETAFCSKGERKESE
jgi:hypothetical protein